LQHRTWVLIAFPLCLLSFALPVFAAEAGSRPHSVLQGVAALEKPVTYTETKIPLGELVQKVASDTGARLTAGREAADEPVAVVVKEMPARELLEQLADLLAYRWVKAGKARAVRYEIGQDVAGRQQEAALRAGELDAAEKRLREQIRRYAEMARRPPAQIQAEFDADVRRLLEIEKQPKEQHDAFLGTPEGRELFSRYDAADAVSTPVPRVLAGLLDRISPRQWSILRSQQQLVLSTVPQSPASGHPSQPLPTEIARLLQVCSLVAPQIRHLPPVDPDQEERDRQAAKERQSYWTGADGYQVTLRMDGQQFERTGKLSLIADAASVPGKEAPPDLFNIPAGVLRARSALWDADLPSMDDSPERRAALEKDPLLGH
jgi:hypothetical protein